MLKREKLERGKYKNLEWYLLEVKHLPLIETGVANGYVLVGKDNYFYDMDIYEDNKSYLLDVHYGVTYSEYTKNKKNKIIGFDSCHSGDNPNNRNLEWCLNEVKNLAKQIYTINIRMIKMDKIIKNTKYSKKRGGKFKRA